MLREQLKDKTVVQEYAAAVMERCVDSNCTQAKHDSPKSPQTWTCPTCKKAQSIQEKDKCKSCHKMSRVRKKIASHNRSVGRPDHVKHAANIKKKIRKQQKRTKPNVLKSKAVSVRQSVQKITKIVNGKVPDRLGSYVSSGASSETKSPLNECSSKTKLSLNECSNTKAITNDRSEIEFLLSECSETKLNMIGNECLSNKEAVSLSNSFESDSETKNIFEKLFDDCLGSTSLEKDMSSQEIVNLETDDETVKLSSKSVEKYTCLLENFENFKKDDERIIENEKTPNKTKRPRCPNPPVKIKDHSNYYTHKKIRHVCEYCQKIFKSNGKLNSHVYSHTGERPFDCSNCGKAFSSKFKLVRHLLIHSEVRKFVCQICDRTFLRNDHLKNHYKVHDPQKKMYKCPKENCQKEYSSLMSHKKHMAYHNVEDGDLKCLICGVKYETKDEVLFHLKSHSGSRLFKSQSDKKFKCEFCDRLFLTRKDVTRHLVVHTGERDFLCQFCPQRFGRKDHLVRHIKKSHIHDDITEIKKLVESKDEKKLDGNEEPKTEVTKVKTLVKKTKTDAGPLTPSATATTKSVTKENNTQTEECNNKTHIVITVHGDVKNRKRKTQDTESKKKSFQKIESSVPSKKQVPSCKNKNSTTQILLQNIPNILIIPNNSIILLRNSSVSNKNINLNKKAPEESGSQETPQEAFPHPENQPSDFDISNENIINDSRSVVPNVNEAVQEEYNFNLNYDSDVYQPSQFPTNFAENDTFTQFQSDLAPFNPQFEETEQLNFDILNQNDLLKRPEMNLMEGNEIAGAQNGLTNENLLSEASRQIRLLETGINTISTPSETPKKIGIVKPMSVVKPSEPCAIDKDLFEEGSENLMLNESILNDFKDEANILQPDAENGILNSIFNQTNESGGNELLRNLLTSGNPVLSPLPGFSQIFHNANANSG